MDVLERLKKNKGTVSSALGKTLANRILSGDVEILAQCMGYSALKVGDKSLKHVRSGAAKAVEIVAEKRPQLVSRNLEKLLPALAAGEAQTRWMIIRTMGFCAEKNGAAAKKAVPYARKFLAEKEGLCLASSADLFLGDYGSLSARHAKEAFPILEQSMKTCMPNEQDWILETLQKLFPVLGTGEKDKARKFAKKWNGSPRKSTQKRAKAILEYGE
jgi:hypothetical protein